MLRKFIQQVYPGRNFYLAGFALAMLFVFVWLAGWPLIISQIAFTLTVIILIADFVLLFMRSNRFKAVRLHAARFSNHDVNPVTIKLWHNYPIKLRVRLVEELPFALQARQAIRIVQVTPKERVTLNYDLIPFERGEYDFGDLICLLQTGLGLAGRRLSFEQAGLPVRVYPSFKQMLRYSRLAQATPHHESGSHSLQKPGQSYEFDHIKEYVAGDDIRNLNWKATARRSQPMVNHFTEERSQEVYAVIDKGRVMRMPFDNLSLLDYSINATMMLSNVVLQRHDKMGVITYSNKEVNILPATAQPRQLHYIQEHLYKLESEFLESDFEKLYLNIRHKLRQRSLLLLFTNFESAAGRQRIEPYLKLLGKHHLLVVIVFENAELAAVADKTYFSTKEVYEQTIAAQFIGDKRKMVADMRAQGINCIMATPAQLTTATINRYIQLKRRQLW